MKDFLTLVQEQLDKNRSISFGKDFLDEETVIITAVKTKFHPNVIVGYDKELLAAFNEAVTEADMLDEEAAALVKKDAAVKPKRRTRKTK